MRPSQVVIAGNKGAVEKAIETSKARGAKRGVLLPGQRAVSFVAAEGPRRRRLAERLRSVPVALPSIPVIHNVDLTTSASPDAVRSALARQAASPVLWVDTIRKLAAEGVTHIGECGPGKVLAGMVKRIAPEIECVALTDPAALVTLQTALQSAAKD
jgi:[acyl-carrier-protein] S-malonyltransferase